MLFPTRLVLVGVWCLVLVLVVVCGVLVLVLCDFGAEGGELGVSGDEDVSACEEHDETKEGLVVEEGVDAHEGCESGDDLEDVHGVVPLLLVRGLLFPFHLVTTLPGGGVMCKSWVGVGGALSWGGVFPPRDCLLGGVVVSGLVVSGGVCCFFL